MVDIKVACPQCGKDALSINQQKKCGQCWKCGYTVGPALLSQVYLPQKEKAFAALTRVPSLREPDIDDEAYAYLKGRNVDDTHHRYDYIQFDCEQKRLYFHITSPAPEYAPSYHTRGIEPKTGWQVFPRTKKEHYVFGGPRFPHDFILVEGIFDALAIGAGAMSILGTKLYPTIETYLSAGKQVHTWFDPDPAGEKASVEIRERLERRGCRVITIKHPLEPSDCLRVHGRACMNATLKQYGWMP